MLKTVRVILILVLICILVVAYFRHTLCRVLIYSTVTKALGLKLSIEDLNLDILNNSLHMRGITLFNPPGFKNKVLGKAKEVYIKYDLLGSLSRRLHLREVKADISEINIIRNKEGNSNVSAFKKKKSNVKSPEKVLPASAAQKKIKKDKEKKRPKFLIDRLEVSLGKATFIDSQAGIGEPAVIIFTVRSPCVFKNVSNLGYVVSSVSAKGGFKNLLDNLLRMIPRDAIKDTAEAIKKKIENVLPKID